MFPKSRNEHCRTSLVIKIGPYHPDVPQWNTAPSSQGMVGILVYGNNHLILSGPLPEEAAALALHWSIVRIGEAMSSSFGQWQIGKQLYSQIDFTSAFWFGRLTLRAQSVVGFTTRTGRWKLLGGTRRADRKCKQGRVSWVSGVTPSPS